MSQEEPGPPPPRHEDPPGLGRGPGHPLAPDWDPSGMLLQGPGGGPAPRPPQNGLEASGGCLPPQTPCWVRGGLHWVGRGPPPGWRGPELGWGGTPPYPRVPPTWWAAREGARAPPGPPARILRVLALGVRRPAGPWGGPRRIPPPPRPHRALKTTHLPGQEGARPRPPPPPSLKVAFFLSDNLRNFLFYFIFLL